MKNYDVVDRAWNRLRLALLWVRKGGGLRRRLVMELRVVPKYLKCVGHTTTPTTQTYYCERELSFDKTPIFRVKMDRSSSMRFQLPHIPCINPQVDFDADLDFEYEHTRPHGEEYYRGYQRQEEAEIDKRAEEFIAKFYHRMKLQRQISYLQYNETPNRSDSS